MQYEGLLYRALNPIYAADPLSGAGAMRYGGRFNKVGRAALYTSLKPEFALREANQVGALKPTTLVSYRARLSSVFDATAADRLAAYDITVPELADDGWREKMLAAKPVPTQELSERLIADGHAGMLVRSFAPANSGGLNLVLWDWSDGLELVDDEQRLRP